MARGAHDALGDSVCSLLVITKDGHVDGDLSRVPGAALLESAHPVPDQRSLDAGAELERRIATLSPAIFPVFLVSGGASSLVESLVHGTTLEDLRALNEKGLSAGWDIARLNAERRRFSRLKGGGVARLLAGRPALALFISDVADDSPDVIGSGLLGADGNIPDAIDRVVVANVDAAVHAVVEAAAARGMSLEKGARRFDGDAAEVARRFLDALRATDADGLVWGGESTVTLPATHGRGGRNSHLALHAARLLRAGERFTILAAGTDGTDGPTSDAGAMIDEGTIERCEIAGVDVERALTSLDSGTALEASGDLVHTGPTGTNVGDFLIGIKATGTVL